MARDWEQTFRSWSGPSSNAEEAKRDRTEEEIRSALEAYAHLKDRSYKVYVKGSYKNNTNVKQDSDIDICVELTEFFRYERPSDSPNATPEQLGITPYTGDYNAAKFKSDVDIALAESFGRIKVARGPIAIKIREAKTTLPADVVPCVELHEYYFDALGHPQYRPGTRIFPDTGDTFDNYPQQQYDQGVIKNGETGKRFKQMVRVLKRLENELVELGKIDELPSYLMECLVYNVHMLFIVSQLFAQASNQTDRVALPAATIGALTYQGMILGQAQQCLNQALNQAIGQSVAAGRVFSPQNWLKSRSAVSDEQLVAGTIVSVLRGLNSLDLAPMLASLTLPPDKFSFRWLAE